MREDESTTFPPEIFQCLAGKRLALIGFHRADGLRLAQVLAAFQVPLSGFTYGEARPGSERLQPFDLLLIQAPAQLEGCEWLSAAGAARNTKPLLFIGPSEVLLQQMPANQAKQFDFLSFPWEPAEAVLRIYHVLSEVTAETTALRAQPGARKARVLVADDDPTVLTLVRAVLMKFGMECLVAHNGGVAVQLAKTKHPDAVILDINMPFLDGFEVLHAIKTDPLTRDIPVIMLTSLRQENDVVRGFKLGADDYVVKPCRPLELAARLQRLLRA